MSSYSGAFSRRDDRRDPPRRDSYSHRHRSSDNERDRDRSRDHSRDRSYQDAARDRDRDRNRERDYRGRDRDRERSPRSHSHVGSPPQPAKEQPWSQRGDATGRHNASPNSSVLHHNGSAKSTVDSDAKAIGQVLRQYGTLITEQASIKIKKEAIDKVLATRRLEYERSMPKHAEFPSMPELQKRYRDRDLGERKALEASWDKNHKEISEISEVFAGQLLEALPSLKDKSLAQLQLSDVEAKFAKLETGLEGKQKALCERQEQDVARQISELKSELAVQLKSELAVQIKSELAAEIKSELAAEIKSELAAETKSELAATLKSELGAQQAKLEKQFKSQLAEAKKLFDSKLQNAKDEAARAKLEALKAIKQGNEAAAQLATQAAEIESLKAKALAQKSPITAVSNHEITVLKESNRSQQSDIGQLFDRIDDLTKRLEESNPGSGTLQTFQTMLVELDRTLQQHDDKLSVIDVDSMDQINEIAIEWNKVRRDVTTMKADVRNLQSVEQRLDQVQKDLKTLPSPIPVSVSPATVAPGWTTEMDRRFKERLVKLTVTFGQLVDAERESRKEQVERTDAELLNLKMRAESVDALTARMTSLAEEHRLKTEKVEQAVVKLNDSMSDTSQQLEGMREQMQTASDNLKDKCESLGFQITNLDSQFTNLSTKNLARHIIGQMEQIYPDGRTILSNIAELDAMLKGLKEKVSWLEATQAELNRLGLLRMLEDKQPAAKKRKIDSSDEHSSPGIRTNGAILNGAA